MNYYAIEATGLLKKVILTGQWTLAENSHFNGFLRAPAGDGQSVPDGLVFRASPRISQADIERIKVVDIPMIQSWAFSRETMELIADATRDIFEFVPIEVLTYDETYRSSGFFLVRFFEHRMFVDRERYREMSVAEKSKHTPFHRSAMDFEFACQDPNRGDAIVNDNFKRLIDPIVRMKYRKLNILYDDE